MDVRALAHRWWSLAGRRGSQDASRGLLGRLVEHHAPEDAPSDALTPDELALLRSLDQVEIDQDIWFAMCEEAMQQGVTALELLHVLADALENPDGPHWVGFCGQPDALLRHRPAA